MAINRLANSDWLQGATHFDESTRQFYKVMGERVLRLNASGQWVLSTTTKRRLTLLSKDNKTRIFEGLKQGLSETRGSDDKRSVVRRCPGSKEERRFATIDEAAEHGFNKSLIKRCCHGKQTQHKGYNWSFYEGD